MRLLATIYMLAVALISIPLAGCDSTTESEFISPVMSAKINGVRWNSTETQLSYPSSTYYTSAKLLVISATSYRDGFNAQSISMGLSPYLADSTYPLGVGNQNQARILIRNTYQEYLTDAAHTGHITIASFDTVAKVATGTFAFTAIDTASKSVLNVTDGTFRVKVWFMYPWPSRLAIRSKN